MLVSSDALCHSPVAFGPGDESALSQDIPLEAPGRDTLCDSVGAAQQGGILGAATTEGAERCKTGII